MLHGESASGLSVPAFLPSCIPVHVSAPVLPASTTDFAITKNSLRRVSGRFVGVPDDDQRIGVVQPFLAARNPRLESVVHPAPEVRGIVLEMMSEQPALV